MKLNWFEEEGARFGSHIIEFSPQRSYVRLMDDSMCLLVYYTIEV